MASKSIIDCVPELQEKYAAFRKKMEEAGLVYIITCTARSFQEQVALYAQGRQPVEETNRLRGIASLPPIAEAENRKKVTWTLASKHIINLYDDITNNDLSRAFDIALLIGRRAHWDLKISVNRNQKPDYMEAADIGVSVGLIAGYYFKNTDPCHYEI